jgi:hypothetical protein
MWLWGTLFVAVFYPIIDGRKQIAAVFRALGAKQQAKHSASGNISSVDVEDLTSHD